MTFSLAMLWSTSPYLLFSFLLLVSFAFPLLLFHSRTTLSKPTVSVSANTPLSVPPFLQAQCVRVSLLFSELSFPSHTRRTLYGCTMKIAFFFLFLLVFGYVELKFCNDWCEVDDEVREWVLCGYRV